MGPGVLPAEGSARHALAKTPAILASLALSAAWSEKAYREEFSQIVIPLVIAR